MSHSRSRTKRKPWVDIARGICAMLVILFHVPDSPVIYQVLYAPFMVPLFFIVSGYLTKNYDGKWVDFFYYKVFNQFIVKCMVVISLITFTATKVAGLILHPTTVPAWLWDIVVTVLWKPRALFFSVLVVCSVYFFIIDKLCRDKTLPMLAVSGGLALIGFAISRPHVIHPWGWDTALVCVFFYTVGYCIRKEKLLKNAVFRPWQGAVAVGAFLVAVAIAVLWVGLDEAVIIVMNNTWPPFPVALLLLVTGNLCPIVLSFIPKKRRFLTRCITYVGKHSLIYFMFGGPIMAYVNYSVALLYNATQWEILQNHYLMCPIIWIIACVFTLIPCRFSDRLCPALNGHFKLPHDAPRRYPKRFGAVCATGAVLCVTAAAAYGSGRWIPNAYYAKRYGAKGVDVSSYQGNIDWPTLAAQDIDFAYIKATEGSDYVDSRFRRNWEGACRTNLAVGAYHFFSYDSPGQTQAALFIQTVPKEGMSLPPAVDVEFYGDKRLRPPAAADVQRELQVLLDALEAHYGQKPILYSTEETYVMYLWDAFSDYRIWTRNVVTETNLEHWDIWQYTDRMRLDGYDGKETFIDMNVLYQDEDFLNQQQ